MNARQIRRAAERSARKLIRKQAVSVAVEATNGALEPLSKPPSQQAAPPAFDRAAINRANAAASTGPRTGEGKARVSQNALTTALTGRTVLLASDDVAVYEQHVRACYERFAPANDTESALVQSIADTEWRLRRIPLLELALYAKGRSEMAAGLTPETSALLELEIYLKYEKQFRNMALQDSRLHRRREKDIVELRHLQAERSADASCELERETRIAPAETETGASYPPEDFGFDFSKAEFTAQFASETAPTSQLTDVSIRSVAGSVASPDAKVHSLAA